LSKDCHADVSRRIGPALNVSQENHMAATDNANQSLVVTAFWEVNPGEEAAISGLLKDFLPQAQREPGVKEFQIHQNLVKPREYFFYEVFAGEAAFADHQQTPHFKNIIVGQAIPKLAKRERSQFRFI
jgi:quinol monooxygenase YgiN